MGKSQNIILYVPIQKRKKYVAHTEILGFKNKRKEIQQTLNAVHSDNIVR